MKNIERARTIVNDNPFLKTLCKSPPGKGKAVIYAGINLINDKVYVGKHVHGVHGSSVFYSRWKRHINGEGGNEPVYNAIKKYGTNNIVWFVVEHVDEKDVSERERYWISSHGFDSLKNGYNRHPGGSGGVITKEHAENIKIALANPNVKAKLKMTNSSTQTKARRSAAMKEVQSRPEVRSKIQNTISKPEAKAAQSAIMMKVNNRPEKLNRQRMAWKNKSIEVLEAHSMNSILQRADKSKESVRIRKFMDTHDRKHEDEYQFALSSNILPWPSRGKPKLPRPQYYRKNGKIGYCGGKQRHFYSIEPEDRKSKNEEMKIRARVRREKRTQHLTGDPQYPQ